MRIFRNMSSTAVTVLQSVVQLGFLYAITNRFKLSIYIIVGAMALVSALNGYFHKSMTGTMRPSFSQKVVGLVTTVLSVYVLYCRFGLVSSLVATVASSLLAAFLYVVLNDINPNQYM